MSIKSILCAYSGEQAKGSGLHYAVQLAKQHDAWITGTMRHGRSGMSRRLKTVVSEDVHRALEQAEDDRAAEIIRRFRQATENSGLQSRADYVDLLPQSGLTLSDLARTYDLIVTGHHSTDEDDEYLAAHPDLLALQSGRPVLVIPDGYEAPASTHHALVAWDGKRAAARALGDAIHILGNLHQVSVITIGNAGLIDPNPGGGVMALLKRHGIKSEYLHRAASGQSIASTLEEVAEEIEASLIVMGAFEHSKFSQDIFGGVTSEILKTSRIPVFMAH